MTESTAAPSNRPCYIVNKGLWGKFDSLFRAVTGKRPELIWSEEEIVYWVDKVYPILQARKAVTV